MPQQQRNVQLEPSLTHGPISGPVNGGLVALALTAVIWASNRVGVQELPVWLPLALAAFGSTIATVVTMVKDSPLPNLYFRIACWMGGGIWSFAALTVAQGHFLFMLIGLVAGTAGAGLSLPVFAKPVDAGMAMPGSVGMVGTPLGTQDAWTKALEVLITRLLGLKQEQEQVTVFRTASWPNGSGATFQVDFSVGSARGLRDIQDIQMKLQQALKLPDGCTIAAKRAGRQGTTLIDVMFFNDMATVYRLPRDWSPRSGKDPFPLGYNGDKTQAMVRLYQDSMIITGIRGGGKTVLMSSITAWLMQCQDVVIWHADLNGGSISSQWMYLTAIGEISGYPIDWVAHNAEEALMMADVAERIAKKRKTAYASLLAKNKTDKLPISPDYPMILIMVDEGGETFGDDADQIAVAASKKFQAVLRIGRAMCVNIIFSSQRATAEYIPAKMKKLANVKVSLRVDDDAELAHLFDWDKGLSSDDLMYPGCAFYKVGGEINIPVMIKTFLTEPDEILACVRATWTWRPALDKISADEGGEIYAQRWNRPDTVAWMASLAGDERAVTEYRSHTQPVSAVALIDEAQNAPGDGVDHRTMMDLRAALDSFDFGGPNPGGTPPPAQGGKHDRDAMVQRAVEGMDVAAAAEEILAREFGVQEPPAADTPPPPSPGGGGGGGTGGEASIQAGVEWTYEFVDGHGTTPVKTQSIREAAMKAGLTSRPNTPSEWVAQLVTDGRLVRVKTAHYVSDRNAPTTRG